MQQACRGEAGNQFQLNCRAQYNLEEQGNMQADTVFVCFLREREGCLQEQRPGILLWSGCWHAQLACTTSFCERDLQT